MALRIDDPYNTVRHGLIDKSEYVIHNWPTPLVISEHGETVHTGARLVEVPAENPVREGILSKVQRTIQGTFELGPDRGFICRARSR